MNEGKVDLLIAAHVHNGAIVQPGTGGQHNYPIVTGGGSTKEDRTLIRVEIDGSRLRATLLWSGMLSEKSIDIRAQKQRSESTQKPHQ